MTTTTAKHTPGPWMVDGPIASNPEIQINYRPMTTLATITNPREHMTDITQEEAEANARVIAAAPEMLEALEAIIRSEQSNLVEFIHHDVIELAEAAIKKAKGEL